MTSPKTLQLNPAVEATVDEGGIGDGDSRDSSQFVAHRLPCTIHFDGTLPTARAFCPLPDPLKAFRGRRLQSDSFQIPSNYKRKLI